MSVDDSEVLGPDSELLSPSALTGAGASLEDSLDDFAAGLLEPEDAGNLNDAVIALKEALLNEMAAPELLEYEEGVVSGLLQLVDDQQRILEESSFSAHETNFVSLYQMDVDRIKYLLASYLRTRLAKIKLFVMSLLPRPGARCPLLSEQEQGFAENYKKLKFEHFEMSGLSQLDPRCAALNEEEIAAHPNLDEWVFVRVKDDIGDYLPEDATEPITMHTGDSFVLRYRSVRDLVKTKAVALS